MTKSQPVDDKELVSESPSNCTYCYTLTCAIRIESTSTSRPKAPITSKEAVLTVGRNELRKIHLQIELSGTSAGQPQILSYDVTGSRAHLRNVANGKCTVEIPTLSLLLQISNCAPRKLNVFMKSLQAKLELMSVEDKTLSAVPRHVSRQPSTFNALSPLTQGEIRKVKQLRAPLGSSSPNALNSSSPASSTTPKRKSISLLTAQLNNRIHQGSVSLKRRSIFGDRAEKNSIAILKPFNLPPKTRIELSKEQKYVVRTVVNSRTNVFFTGSAGTGKSVILMRIIEMLPAECTYITAATGVAASQIGGITLHSFCGFSSENTTAQQCLEQVLRQKHMIKQWKQCSHLIIDEISMIDSKFFRNLEYVARAVRNNDNPFGGIQLIITGDFFQLPPVTRDNKDPSFCFESEAWNRCIQRTIVLKNVKRQNDEVFVNILNSVRIGKCDPKSADLLRQSFKNKFPHNVVPTKLCTHSEDAERINLANLEEAHGEEQRYHAFDEYNYNEKARTMAVDLLRLKIGAQVMLIKNIDVLQGLCNGSRGIVEGFAVSGNPIVKFIAQDLSIEIRRSNFSVRVPGVEAPCIRRQFPLQLAWAISIHKSQGMTLDCAEISLERVFADGQAYVALSRARSLASIRVTGFDISCVRANSKVLEYYESVEDNDVENDDFDEPPAAKMRKYRSF